MTKKRFSHTEKTREITDILQARQIKVTLITAVFSLQEVSMFFQTREITDILQARQIKVTNYSCIFPSRGMHVLSDYELLLRSLRSLRSKYLCEKNTTENVWRNGTISCTVSWRYSSRLQL
ncbi:uncharacterized protein [Acropora muricata]|uniref:uncharacterized protein isoform X3 n=1 Tax=Acropora muricata TaxID=159855 RepID=UPI0034E585BA